MSNSENIHDIEDAFNNRCEENHFQNSCCNNSFNNSSDPWCEPWCDPSNNSSFEDCCGRNNHRNECC